MLVMRGFITFSTHLVLSEQTTQSLSFLPGKKKKFLPKRSSSISLIIMCQQVNSVLYITQSGPRLFGSYLVVHMQVDKITSKKTENYLF